MAAVEADNLAGEVIVREVLKLGYRQDLLLGDAVRRNLVDGKELGVPLSFAYSVTTPRMTPSGEMLMAEVSSA